VTNQKAANHFLPLRKRIAAFCFIALCFSASGQVDSLKRILPKNSGKEKVLLLNELAYQLMYEQPKEAVLYGRQAVDLAKQTTDSLLIAQSYNDLSLPFIVLGDFDSVLYYNQLAYEIRWRAGDKLKAAANLSKLSQACFEMGDFNRSFSYLNRAHQIFLAEKDTVRLVHVSNSFGSLFEKFQKWEEAGSWYKKSENWALKMGMERDYMIARINQGMMNRRQKKYPEAERILLSCKDYIDSKGFANDKAYFYEALGVLYRVSGKPARGEEFYRIAMKANEETGSVHGIANSYRNLAYCLGDQGKTKEALQFFLKAQALFSQAGALDPLQAVELDLYETYKKLGQPAEALVWLEKQKVTADSVYNVQTQKTVAEYTARFEVEKHKASVLKRDKDLLEAQVQIKRRNQYLLGAGALLVVGGLVIGFYTRLQRLQRERLKTQAQNALNEERLRISRDLHDNLGADLTWISSELSMQAYKETNVANREQLESMSDKMQEAGRSLRDTIWAIHSERISVQEMIARLAGRSGSVLKEAGISLETVQPDEPIELGPAASLHLFRMVKECITNVLKHSEATELRISVTEKAQKVTVEIADNGKGLPEAESNGYGLKNLENRAKEAGFELLLARPKEGGLKISISMPHPGTIAG